MKRSPRVLIATVLTGLLAGASARAQGPETNYWTNTSGGYWTNANNWTPSSVPTSNHWPVFNNDAASAYTVMFTGFETNEPLNVVQDKVTFDLQGNTWRIIRGTGGVHGQEYTNIGTSGAPAQVTFKSTGGQGTATVVRTVGSQFFNVGAGSTLTITNARLDTTDMYFGGNGTINILGPGAELYNAGYEGGISGSMNILDGGLATLSIGAWGVNIGNGAQIVAANGGTLDARGASARGLHVGNTGTATLSVLSNGTVLASTITMGQNVGNGEVLVDDSEVYTRSLLIGSAGYSGKVVLTNGAVLTVGTNWWGSHTIPYTVPADGTIEIPAKASGATNTLVINNATIRLGGGAMAGTLTNRGFMKAMGTITGLGPSPATVYSEKDLEVGGSVGTLTLNNANLELAAGSVTLWEFSDTGLDQINVVGGSALLDGTNLFSIVGSTNGLTSGVKWGLGTYDFVLGTGVTVGANFYADMTNLLSGIHSLQYGVDYRFGWVDTGTGLQALRLEFVPEPSTILLLVGGGLVLYRVRRRYSA